MLTVLRHLASILLLPFMAAVVAPWWLIGYYPAGGYDGVSTAISWLLRSAGMLFLGTGLVLFFWCVSLFARIGRGTLAPWDPPRRFVAAGPYRHVRNPMISGVALTLIGQALLRESTAVAIWAGFFICINHIYFVASEEPGLEKRFGGVYRTYKANVPRWLPRMHAWSDRTQAQEHPIAMTQPTEDNLAAGKGVKQ